MTEATPLGFLLAAVAPDLAATTDIGRLAQDSKLLQAAAGLSERNGLYYALLRNLRERNVTLPSEYEAAWQQLEDGLRRLQATVNFLNETSAKTGAAYIWIKSCDTIPHVPRDVDILVKPQEAAAFSAVLQEAGMKQDQPSKVQFLLEKEGLLRIDIYTQLHYLGMDFIGNDFLWNPAAAASVSGTSYPALNREADFLLLLAHALFGHRSISLMDVLHLGNILPGVDLAACREEARRNGWATAFDLVLEELRGTISRLRGERPQGRFPYIYRTGFVLKCVAGIEKLNLRGRRRLAFRVSIWMDQVRSSQKDTPLYKMLRSFEPTRRLANKIITIFRTMRGDETA